MNKTPFYLFLLAVVLRIVRLVLYVGSPFFGAPHLDSLYNHEWALRVAGGDLLGGNLALFRAPLYPYFLGGIYYLLGTDFFISFLIQHLLGALGAVAMYFLFRRLFGERTGIAAGLLYAVYPPFIFFEGDLLDIWIQVMLYPFILLSMLRLRDKPCVARGFEFGALCGLSVIGRPALLPMLPFMAVLFGWWLARENRLREMTTPALAAFAALALLIAPVTLRNWIAANDPVLVATYAGINFYVGNGPNADGFTAQTPKRFYFSGAGPYQDSVELFAQSEATSRMGRPLKGSEVSSFWLNEGLRAISENPMRWIVLMLKKATLFWSGLELRNNKDLDFALQFDSVLRPIHYVLSLRLLAPLAVLGLWIAWSNKRSFGLSLATLFIALYFLSLICFFVNTRYRLPIVPILLGFSAYAVVEFAREIRERDARHLRNHFFGLLMAAVFVNVNWWHVPAHEPGLDYWIVGNALKDKGRFDEAEIAYKKSLSYDESNWEAWETLGETCFAQRKMDAAIESFKTALSIYPDDVRARNNLGVCYEESGQYENARREYLTVVKQEPRHGLAWLNLGDCELKMGNAQSAAAAYDKSLEINPSLLLAHWGALRAALQNNDRAKALQHYNFISQHATGDLRSATESLRPQITSLQEFNNSKGRDELTTSTRVPGP